MKKLFFVFGAIILLANENFCQAIKPAHPALISVFLAEIGSNAIALDNSLSQTAGARTEAELHSIIRTNQKINYRRLVEEFRDQTLSGFNMSWIPEKDVLSSPIYKSLSADITFKHDLGNDAPAGYYAIMNFDKKAIKKSFDISTTIDAVAIGFLKFQMNQESRVMDKGKLKIECTGYLTFFDRNGKKTINIRGSEKSSTFTFSYRNGFEQGNLDPFMSEAMNKVIEELKGEFVRKVK